MLLPRIQGLIRRRILVNFRGNPEVVQRLLPPPFAPKLHRGFAIVGICLIRLEEIRPRGLPRFVGMTSENAAHRIAVEWRDAAGAAREGVFIPRRDTESFLNALAGGRVFPGEHHPADFDVIDDGSRISLKVRSRDGTMRVELAARESDALPPTSCFGSTAEASAFFEGGSIGYSTTRDGCRLDGIRLETERWSVRPLEVEHVVSSFFEDPDRFPSGSVTFDHAFVLRDLEHAWHAEEDIVLAAQGAHGVAGGRP